MLSRKRTKNLRKSSCHVESKTCENSHQIREKSCVKNKHYNLTSDVHELLYILPHLITPVTYFSNCSYGQEQFCTTILPKQAWTWSGCPSSWSSVSSSTSIRASAVKYGYPVTKWRNFLQSTSVPSSTESDSYLLVYFNPWTDKIRPPEKIPPRHYSSPTKSLPTKSPRRSLQILNSWLM